MKVDPASVAIKLNIRCEKKGRIRMTYNCIVLMNGDDISKRGKRRTCLVQFGTNHELP